MKYSDYGLDAVYKLKDGFINKLIGMNIDYGVCMLISGHMNLAFSVIKGGVDIRWMSILNEMPTPSTRIMLYDPETSYKFHLGTFQEGRNAFVRHDNQILHHVTHWKELDTPSSHQKG